MLASIHEFDAATGRAKITRIVRLPRGRRGTKATLEMMRRAAIAGMNTASVRALAVFIVAQVQEKNWIEEARAVRAWVADAVRYVRDLTGAETLQSAELTLKTRAGDCDDQAVLVAALLASIGHSVRFRAISLQPGKFAHVYCEAYLAGRWQSVETTERWPVGFEPRGIVESLIEPVAIAGKHRTQAMQLEGWGIGRALKKIGRSIDDARRSITDAVMKPIAAVDPTGLTGKAYAEAKRAGRKINEETRRAFVDVFPVVLTVVTGGTGAAIAIAIASASFGAYQRSQTKQKIEQVNRAETAFYDAQLSEANRGMASAVALDILQRRAVKGLPAGEPERAAIEAQIMDGLRAGQSPAESAAMVLARNEFAARGIDTKSEAAQADLAALVAEVRAQLEAGASAKHVKITSYEQAKASGEWQGSILDNVPPLAILGGSVLGGVLVLSLLMPSPPRRRFA